MRILGIETSCDETAFAIYDSEQGLLAHVLHSQIELHQRYGGVVPELASRDHTRKLVPLLNQTLRQANLSLPSLDGIAYTIGPGLAGALMVGALFGRSLAYALKIPALGIHHLEAHLLAPMLDQAPPAYPFLALLVSGGHTLLIQVNQLGDYKLLGDTLDDAVGEAFDKTAKLLSLSYPGGPHVAALAEKGHPERFHFPRPMIDRPGLDFSFSGLKTYVRNTVEKYQPLDEQTKADIARAFQDAVVETLMIKCRRAIAQTHLSQLIVAGGVSANVALRQRLNRLSKKSNCKIIYPRQEFCTDNGAMIAYAGCQRLMNGQQDDLSIQVKPRWSLESLSGI